MGYPKRRIKTNASVASSTAADKVRDLDCFEDVDSLIRLGFPPRKILQYIRSRDEWTDIADQAALSYIEAYRKSLPAGEIVKVRLPSVFIEAVDKLKEGLDEIKELEELYRIQKERIEIDYKTEKKIGKLFRTTVGEIRAAMDILKTLADLKMDLGLVERQIGRVSVEIDANARAQIQAQFPENPLIANVLGDPQKRAKIYNVITQLARVVSRHELPQKTLQPAQQVEGESNGDN